MNKETIVKINKANEIAQFFEECAKISRQEGNIKLALIQERRAEEHRQNAMRYACGK